MMAQGGCEASGTQEHVAGQAAVPVPIATAGTGTCHRLRRDTRLARGFLQNHSRVTSPSDEASSPGMGHPVTGYTKGRLLAWTPRSQQPEAQG